jgi:hypothetical protein
MAEEPKGKEQKSLEMRVAELEDKLSKVHITEEELKAYQKVSSLLGTSAASPRAGCVVDCSGGCINECMIRACTIVRNCTIIRYCTIVRQCIFDCVAECGGGCAPGGGGAAGGGFGSLGG